MIGMLLNVVHDQVKKNLQNHITKKFNGIHNHFTLLTMMLLKAILRQPYR